MRKRRFAGVIFVAVACLVCAGKPLAIGQDKTSHPAGWEARMVARMPEAERLKYERLKTPAFAKLDLLPRLAKYSEPPEDVNKPNKVGDNIYFRLLITNTSIESVSFSGAEIYYYDRPELLRDGSPVPYRRGLSELLRSKEERPFDQSVRVITLPPRETVDLTVEMNRWYEPLQPGRYMLTVKRRFIWGGDWIESPSIIFEVIPK